MTSAPTPAEQAMAAVIEHVRDRLETRFPDVSRDLVEEIRHEDRAYADLVPVAELHERIRLNLVQAVTAVLAHAHGAAIDLSDAEATGRRRAEQGLPLTSLLHAYRRGMRLLWDTIVEVVGTDDPDSVPLLLASVGHIWDVAEQLTDAVSVAYRQTDEARTIRARERRDALLDGLLDGTGVAAGFIPQAVAHLGLPERGRYAVIAMSTSGGAPHGTPPGRILWRLKAHRAYGVADLRETEPQQWAGHFAGQPVQAGVSPIVESLTDISRARWFADLALRTCDGAGRPESVLLDARLPAALVAAQSDVAARLRTVVLGPVLALPRTEREVLLTTLSAWLTCGGSAAAAATHLYCHRNTVLNRLHRIEQLTGRDFAVPADLVELALAHDAVRLAGER